MSFDRYCSILNKDIENYKLTSEDKEFFNLHGLSDYITSIYPNGDSVDYKKNEMIKKLNYKKKIAELTAVTTAFESRNIKYLVLKGLFVAEAYPLPYTRYMSDYDVLVPIDMFDEAVSVLTSIGYSRIFELQSFKDVSFIKDGNLKIELHHTIFDPFFFDRDKKFLESLFEKVLTFNIYDRSFVVPNVSNHYKYIVLHMIKHLKGAGIGLRSLLDFYYLTKKYAIDPNDYLPFFDESGYGKLYRALVIICNKYFDVSASDLCILTDHCNDSINTLIQYIAESGIYGDASENIRIMKYYNYYGVKARLDKGVFGLITSFIGVLFPKSKMLSKRYNYARKNSFLLPFAWLHRIMRGLLFDKRTFREKFFYFTKNDNYILKIDEMLEDFGLR